MSFTHIYFYNFLQRLRREADLWASLSEQDHPNILPFYGDFQKTEVNVGDDPEEVAKQRAQHGNFMYLVSPWASGGDARDFLGPGEGENRATHGLKLVRTSAATTALPPHTSIGRRRYPRADVFA